MATEGNDQSKKVNRATLFYTDTFVCKVNQIKVFSIQLACKLFPFLLKHKNPT